MSTNDQDYRVGVGRIEQLTGGGFPSYASPDAQAGPGPGCQPVRYVTEADVRRIVREELQAFVLRELTKMDVGSVGGAAPTVSASTVGDP